MSRKWFMSLWCLFVAFVATMFLPMPEQSETIGPFMAGAATAFFLVTPWGDSDE